MDTAEEAYLRVDIPCGSPSCPTCAPTSPALPPAPRHLAVPDAAALRGCLDVWELAQVEGAVLLSSELKQVRRAWRRAFDRPSYCSTEERWDGGKGAPRSIGMQQWVPGPAAAM